MSTKPPPQTWVSLTAALDEMIAASGMSYPQLEKATGLHRRTLKGFAEGEQSLRLDLADKLAAYFGLVVCEKPPRKRPAKKRKRTTKSKRTKKGR